MKEELFTIKVTSNEMFEDGEMSLELRVRLAAPAAARQFALGLPLLVGRYHVSVVRENHRPAFEFDFTKHG